MKLEYIKWEDHSSFEYNVWRSFEDLTDGGPFVVETVGWVLKETDEILFVASHVWFEGEKACGDIKILKKTVMQRKTIKGYDRGDTE